MKVQNESVGVSNGAAGAWATILTWRCMLNYLSKDYRRDGRDKSTLNWSISAESFRAPDARVLESDVKAYDRSLSCRGGCGLDDSRSPSASTALTMVWKLGLPSLLRLL